MYIALWWLLCTILERWGWWCSSLNIGHIHSPSCVAVFVRLFQHICPHAHMLTILLITLPSYKVIWKHTPPHFHHMLKGKFEVAKNSGHCLTTRYNVNKMPLFPHPKKVFNQSFVLATCFITLVWHQTHTWNEDAFLRTYYWPELFSSSWYDHRIVVHGILLRSLCLLETAYVHEKKNHDLKVSKVNVF